MKNLNKIILIIASSLVTGLGYSQQYPMYNMQFMDQSLYNPSLTGIGDQINTTLLYKSYLTGISGNPTTQYFNIDAPLVEDKVGGGLRVYNDNQGISNKLGVYASGAYKVNFSGDDHNLNFGLSLGMLQYSINEDEIEVESAADPLLVNKNYSSSTLDGNFGMTYINKNFQLGVGVLQLFGARSKLAEDVNFNLKRTLMASAKYSLYLNSDQDVALSPMIIARFGNSPQPQEGYLIFDYKDQFFVAPSYRSTGAIGVSVAAKVFNGFKIGYSYETVTKAPVSGFQNGGHEVLLGYSFDMRSKLEKRLDDKIKRIDEKLDLFEMDQLEKDRIQDENLKKQKENIDQNKNDIENNKVKIKEIDENLKKTQKELEDLKNELREAGILKEENATDFGSEEKGYYIVISSVKDVNISEDRMQSKYISKGYKRMYNKKTGWHYVYNAKFKDFNKALKKLKETRSGEFDDAWIHFLK